MITVPPSQKRRPRGAASIRRLRANRARVFLPLKDRRRLPRPPFTPPSRGVPSSSLLDRKAHLWMRAHRRPVVRALPRWQMSRRHRCRPTHNRRRRVHKAKRPPRGRHPDAASAPSFLSKANGVLGIPRWNGCRRLRIRFSERWWSGSAIHFRRSWQRKSTMIGAA